MGEGGGVLRARGRLGGQVPGTPPFHQIQSDLTVLYFERFPLNENVLLKRKVCISVHFHQEQALGTQDVYSWPFRNIVHSFANNY